MSLHVPVMVEETMNALCIEENGVYVDVTYGGGGHSKEILKRMNKNGVLIGLDKDKEVFKNKTEDKRLIRMQAKFSSIKNTLQQLGYSAVDGILADLGVSSMQIDTIERGFTYKNNTELDMRMDQDSSLDAKHILNNYNEKLLSNMFKTFGEINNASGLAKKITERRKTHKINTNRDLLDIIDKLISGKNKFQYYSKVFQSIRIEVNAEIEELKHLLLQCVDLVKPGGRVAILSYHSLEDRLVKNFFKHGNFTGNPDKDIYGNTDLPFKRLNPRPLTPSFTEIKNNPRSRSAKLRFAEKI